MLAAREIDVAPSSSIEYALHADEYRLVPDLVIGSRGPVRSILLLSDRPPDRLGGELVALPTASATSVVLLKILFSMRWGVQPRFRWFDQSAEDPFSSGTAASLFIGDVALRPALHPELPFRFDLGAEWWDQTKLPFAFALWQSSAGDRTGDVLLLHDLLVESRSWATRQRAALAARYASTFRMGPPELERYWSDLSFDLNDEMLAGLMRFYQLAAEIGEIPEVPPLRWIG